MAPGVRGLVVVVLLTLTPGVAGAADRLFRSDRDGIEFRYPDRFVPGQYKRQPLDPQTLKQLQESGVGEPYANAIALIESARVGGFAATDIPIGEVGRRVFRLPGFPGPYGIRRSIISALREVVWVNSGTFGCDGMLRSPAACR